jgi:hypothetical protein
MTTATTEDELARIAYNVQTRLLASRDTKEIDALRSTARAVSQAQRALRRASKFSSNAEEIERQIAQLQRQSDLLRRNVAHEIEVATTMAGQYAATGMMSARKHRAKNANSSNSGYDSTSSTSSAASSPFTVAGEDETPAGSTSPRMGQGGAEYPSMQNKSSEQPDSSSLPLSEYDDIDIWFEKYLRDIQEAEQNVPQQQQQQQQQQQVPYSQSAAFLLAPQPPLTQLPPVPRFGQPAAQPLPVPASAVVPQPQSRLSMLTPVPSFGQLVPRQAPSFHHAAAVSPFSELSSYHGRRPTAVGPPPPSALLQSAGAAQKKRSHARKPRPAEVYKRSYDETDQPVVDNSSVTVVSAPPVRSAPSLRSSDGQWNAQNMQAKLAGEDSFGTRCPPGDGSNEDVSQKKKKKDRKAKKEKKEKKEKKKEPKFDQPEVTEPVMQGRPTYLRRGTVAYKK